MRHVAYRSVTLNFLHIQVVTKELESETWLSPVLSDAMSDSVVVLDTGPIWKKYEDMSASVSLSHSLVSGNKEDSIGSNDGLTCRELTKVIKEMSREERSCTNLCEAAVIRHIIIAMMKVSIQ
jgi:hypothetical protein